jgi:mannose-6-phosphate isomerase-like protein (cupin superfamily)
MSKYEHIKDESVRGALEDYKEKIDELKPDELSLSTYKVEKPWGHEVWLEMNEFYALKLIHFKQGNRCSLQLHERKVESVYVLEGEAEVFLENDEGVMESSVYGPGTGWTVPVNKKHRVHAKTDFTILEAQSPHLNDIIRFQDDSNRTSGTIKEEHEGN